MADRQLNALRRCPETDRDHKLPAAEADKQCGGPHYEHQREGHEEPLPRVEHLR
jgi:hypothetical protein